MRVKTGQTIEAVVTSKSSNYLRVRGEVKGGKVDGRIFIDATEVVSRWGNGEWEKHPTSCAMTIMRENISVILN